MLSLWATACQPLGLSRSTGELQKSLNGVFEIIRAPSGKSMCFPIRHSPPIHHVAFCLNWPTFSLLQAIRGWDFCTNVPILVCFLIFLYFLPLCFYEINGQTVTNLDLRRDLSPQWSQLAYRSKPQSCFQWGWGGLLCRQACLSGPTDPGPQLWKYISVCLFVLLFIGNTKKTKKFY